MKYISLLLIFIIHVSCISKGDQNITGEQGPQDITISLLKISPPSVVMGVGENTQFNVVGGNEPYTYSISSGFGSIDQTGRYTAPGSLGNNTIKVTDAGGNSVYAVVTVGSSLQISPTSKTMGTSENFTLSGVGGVAPYTFSIVSGGGSINAASGEYTSGATPETITIEIRDANNDVAYSIITVVDALTVTPSSLTVEDLSVSNLSVAGGTAPYTYQVYAGSGSIDGSGNYTAPNSEGTEIVRITDNNSNYVEATIYVKKGPSISITDSTLAPGQQATVSSLEGTAPFVYTVESGMGSIDGATGVFTAPSIASNTVIRATDANGFYAESGIQTYNLKKLALGDNFACMLHLQNDNASSEVKCWGIKEYGLGGENSSISFGDEAGEMGDNLAALDFGSSNTPVGIYSSIYYHRCAVFSNGKMKCWGDGSAGKRGSGNQTDMGEYRNMMGDYLPVTTIGDGVLVDLTLPVEDRVSLGGHHSCVAIDSNDTMKCFGEGSRGRTGNGNQTDYCNAASNCNNNLPEVNIGAGKSIVKIATGLEHSCAIIAPDMEVKCWGEASYGRLGYGNTTDLIQSPNAVAFVDLGTGRTAIDITAGYYHTCALLDNNDVKCWGRNNTGQLGLEIATNQNIGDAGGEMGDSLAAVDLGSVSFPVSIKTKGYHNCAIFNNGSMKCWGYNIRGQLGTGNTTQKGDNAGEMGDNLAFIDVGSGETVLSVDVSERTTCVITSANEAKCWGDNTYGQLGIESTTRIGDGSNEMGDNLTPIDLGSGRTPTMISTSTYSTCALLDNNTIKCWGLDEQGNLGLESNSYGDHVGEDVASKTAIDFGTGEYAIDIFAGRNHACAILNSGDTKCWGAGAQGRLGTGSTGNLGDQPNEMGDNLIIADMGSGLTATSGDAGNNHSCAVLDSGDIKCWGDGANGRRGSGNQTDRGDGANEMGDNLSIVDLGTGRTAQKVSTGENWSCALMDNNQAKCWGYGQYGRRASGDTATRGDGANEMGNNLTQIDMGTGRYVTQIELSSGGEHSCFLLDNGDVKCTGRGNYGQLGHEATSNLGDSGGETGDGLPKVDLGTTRTALMISVGYRHTCAILDNYKVKCWGDNGQGQLGTGNTTRYGDAAGEMGDNLPYTLLPDADKPLRIYSGLYYNCVVLESNEVKCWGYNYYGQLGHEHRYNVGSDPLSMDGNLPATH